MSDNTKRTKSSDAGVFYLALLCAVAVVQIALKILITFVPEAESQVLSRIMEAGMLLATGFLALRTTFVQPWLGLKVEKAERKQTLLACLLLALGIVALFIIARLVMQRISSAVAARPFFRTYLNIKHRRYYIFFVLVQELLAKGVLQHGVEKTLPREKWYLALPVSALVFGMMHIYHSRYYLFGAIALALVSGLFYHRQKNVWASFTLHFLVAFLPRCFGLK